MLKANQYKSTVDFYYLIYLQGHEKCFFIMCTSSKVGCEFNEAKINERNNSKFKIGQDVTKKRKKSKCVI